MSLPRAAQRPEQAPQMQADLLKERGILSQPARMPKIQTKIIEQLHYNKPINDENIIYEATVVQPRRKVLRNKWYNFTIIQKILKTCTQLLYFIGEQ